MQSSKHLKTCEFGHTYYKSSDCLACPSCAQREKPKEGFMARLSAPARRALVSNNIISLAQLTTFSQAEIAALHGMGPSGIIKLEQALMEAKLTFKQ